MTCQRDSCSTATRPAAVWSAATSVQSAPLATMTAAAVCLILTAQPSQIQAQRTATRSLTFFMVYFEHEHRDISTFLMLILVLVGCIISCMMIMMSFCFFICVLTTMMISVVVITAVKHKIRMLSDELKEKLKCLKRRSSSSPSNFHEINISQVQFEILIQSELYLHRIEL